MSLRTRLLYSDCCRKVERNERNACNATQPMCTLRSVCNARNATDVYVTICMQRTQRMQRNATDAYVTICMQRTQRNRCVRSDLYATNATHTTQRNRCVRYDLYATNATHATQRNRCVHGSKSVESTRWAVLPYGGVDLPKNLAKITFLKNQFWFFFFLGKFSVYLAKFSKNRWLLPWL